MSLVLSGSTSGSITLQEPAVAGSSTINLPAGTGTMVVNGVNSSVVSGTAVNTTSGTSIDFTSIPSWVKRITVMFNGVSTNSTSSIIVQIGSGSVLTSGYNASVGVITNTSFTSTSNISSGFAIVPTGVNINSYTYYGQMIISTMGSNIWQATGNFGIAAAALNIMHMAGGASLSGTLDQVRLTTVNGTDTFDAGSINILYE